MRARARGNCFLGLATNQLEHWGQTSDWFKRLRGTRRRAEQRGQITAELDINRHPWREGIEHAS
jgi:hypothetical protein